MSTRVPTVTVLTAALLLAACSPDGGDLDFLPGHSRPVLEHDWPHPSELDFEDSGFRPADPEVALMTTPSGARAYVVADALDPLVQVMAAVPLGRHFEGADDAGAAEVSAAELRRALVVRLGPDFVGDTEVSQEGGMTWLSVEVMVEDWHRALTALVGTLRAPGLEASAIGASGVGSGPGVGRGGGRARALAELTALVARYPIAPPDRGVRVRPRSVRDLGMSALRPESVVFGIGGGVSRAEAEAELLEMTEGWMAPRDGAAARAARAPTLAAGRVPAEPLHTIDVPGFMSWIALGHTMEAIAAEDEAAVRVMEEVVNIRLNIATREVRGLTNRAMLLLPATTDGAGLLYLRTSGRSESVAPLIRYSVEELTRIRQVDGAPTPEELDQAKGGLALGWWQDSLDGARRTAATYAMETVRRGSLDHLMAWPGAVGDVTAEEVTAVAAKYIDPNAMTAVVVGQIDEVREARHPRWPVALDEAPSLLRPHNDEP